MIEITSLAQNYLLKLLNNEDQDTRIRILINQKNENNVRCELSFCNKNSTLKDLELKFKGFSLYLEKKNIKYLKKSKIDIIQDELNCRLTIYTPNLYLYNQSKKNSIVSDLREFIEKKINSRLMMHGGRLNLVKLTKDKVAFVQFSGGCHGCSMSNYTFKDIIEKEITSNFNIKSVVDITNHLDGKNSYY